MTDYTPGACPYCGGTNTYRRTGAHFDHERMCIVCRRSFDPWEEWEQRRQAEQERLAYNTHKE